MALNLSDVPFTEIVSGVRVADVDGEFIPNPSFEQLEESTMDLVVAGTDDIVCMIEGECLEVPEERLLDAIEFAHELDPQAERPAARAAGQGRRQAQVGHAGRRREHRDGRQGRELHRRRAEGSHRGQGQVRALATP